MAVRRRGEEGRRPQAVQSLGRVLVTIDDLQALRELIEGLPTEVGSVVMEFPGGEFDEATDLRQLSDGELRHLRIKGRSVEVELGPDRAVAVGDPEACRRVRDGWSRARQTNVRADPIFHGRSGLWSFWLLSLAGTVCVLLGATGRVPAAPTPVEPSARWAMVLVGAFAYVIAAFAILGRPTSYAVIKAVTLDERRREVVAGTRHWQTTAIALGALLVAALGVLVTLLVSK